MIPVLFEIGPIKIYSYGLMLGIGFLLGSYVLSLEFKRKGINPNLASNITIIALIFGIAGAKLLYLIENWSAFIQAPIDMAFSAGGLTWYGGFFLGLLAVVLYVRAKKVPLLKFLDALGIALLLAYGIGRLGCHFSGDGDYGFPTDLPWGTNYEKGTYPPDRAFRIFYESEEMRRLYPEIIEKFPHGVPANTPCHPTPVYEMLLGVAGFCLMWFWLRKKPYPDGKLFALYLVLSSVFRFSVEFLRLNPRLLFGLSEAQLFSAVLFLVGVVWILRLNAKPSSPASGS
jgi:phosphatidylglycerol:prolipoprotein diacylglycerol transferase